MGQGGPTLRPRCENDHHHRPGRQSRCRRNDEGGRARLALSSENELDHRPGRQSRCRRNDEGGRARLALSSENDLDHRPGRQSRCRRDDEAARNTLRPARTTSTTVPVVQVVVSLRPPIHNLDHLPGCHVCFRLVSGKGDERTTCFVSKNNRNHGAGSQTHSRLVNARVRWSPGAAASLGASAKRRDARCQTRLLRGSVGGGYGRAGIAAFGSEAERRRGACTGSCRGNDGASDRSSSGEAALGIGLSWRLPNRRSTTHVDAAGQRRRALGG